MRRILTALMIGMSLMLGTLSGNVCAQSVKELSRHDLQSWKMRYVIIEDDERNMIINVFDGDKMIISDMDQDNIRVSADVIDINKDGISEILVTRHSGGNCCFPELSLYFLNHDRSVSFYKFEQWDAWGGWDDAKFSHAGQETTISMENAPAGVGYTKLEKYKTTYTYDGQNVEFLNKIAVKKITAINEIQSSDFKNLKQTDFRSIFYDLNRDGKNEIIQCSYWERWGSLSSCQIKNSQGVQILLEDSTSFHPKRIGILDEQFNGWHVLVSDLDKKLIYDRARRGYIFWK